MSIAGQYTEGVSVEIPAIDLFGKLQWEHINAYREKLGPDGTLGRESEKEVFLLSRLRAALERLNPDATVEALDQALGTITKDRSALYHARANREIHELLRDRVPVTVRKPDGSRRTERITVIDWDNPDKNSFLLVSQLWIRSDLYRRRTDLLGFVNGVPLVFIELKAAHRNLRHAYDDNLRDYRDAIPHVFTPNGFIILSNGAESKFGTITSQWEHFLEWKKINSEGETGRVSLETVIRGMCTPERLLDILGNFAIFQELPGGLIKLVARNHQYLGVNTALARLHELRAVTRSPAEPEEPGVLKVGETPAPPVAKLGVFWHAQGSGKTVSMIFFTQKVLRTMLGNWTFVIVTDREDLDEATSCQVV